MRRFDVKASKAYSSVPLGLRWATFHHPKLAQRVRADLTAFGAGSRIAAGSLVIAGPSHAGKSSLAAALFHGYLAAAASPEEAKRREDARFLLASDLAADVVERPWWRATVRPAGIAAGPLVVLDGVGEEGPGVAAVAALLEARLAARLPTWVTTRLRRRGLEMRYGIALVDRLFARSSSFELDWSYDYQGHLRRSSVDDVVDDEEEDTIELPSLFPLEM